MNMRTTIKQWVLTNWAVIALVIVSLLYFKSCQGSKDLQIANSSLKKDVQISEMKASNVLSKNKVLLSKVDSLEKLKQKVIVEVQKVQKKTETEIKKVPALTTKGIATYYQDRYKLPVTITQYGVSLSDTIGKLNITELIQKDGCFAQQQLLKQQLVLEEEKGLAKDTIFNNLIIAYSEIAKANFNQKKIITNTEKSLKKEKTKKTFWQVAAGAAAVGVGVLVLR
jgi:hypothetical protein